jgi:hypothetical protein
MEQQTNPYEPRGGGGRCPGGLEGGSGGRCRTLRGLGRARLRFARSQGSLARMRGLVLVDLENLCGRHLMELVADAARRRTDEAAWASEVRRRLRTGADALARSWCVLPGDLGVVVANRTLLGRCDGLFVVAEALPELCCRVAERGRNGADRVLSAFVEPERVATRFGRLVVASGDAWFAGYVREVREAARLVGSSVVVEVVARDASLSNELRGLADRLVLLGGELVPAEAAVPGAA